MHRRLLPAVLAAALAFSATPAIAAPAFTLNGAPIATQQEAVQHLASAADSILKDGATLTVGDYSIVYDPRALGQEISSQFTPDAGTSNGGVTMQRGRTADGRTVVTPTTGTFTSGYGQRWGAMHRGIDIANSLGTPIYAVMDGTVINAGPAQGFGNWVVIQHDGGEVSVYGHMAHYNVAVGQRVRAGEQIAQIGNEGQSTGPHLHFEIKPDGVNQVDPVPWFAQQGIRIA
ncbi:M23 family metallopeptidase [Corynebacterium imitans]|uniref:M23 family metallopeptidase n=1 Tax=Corynebacterium imitans TaxID=156978 RepID=UPI001EF39985|nr:M23 family metallopeptidase [Corynebacterium imitans]MCG7279486.1 M23 family metallopeptidase [Corynebacterium imitans]